MLTTDLEDTVQGETKKRKDVAEEGGYTNRGEYKNQRLATGIVRTMAFGTRKSAEIVDDESQLFAKYYRYVSKRLKHLSFVKEIYIAFECL